MTQPSRAITARDRPTGERGQVPTPQPPGPGPGPGPSPAPGTGAVAPSGSGGRVPEQKVHSPSSVTAVLIRQRVQSMDMEKSPKDGPAVCDLTSPQERAVGGP